MREEFCKRVRLPNDDTTYRDLDYVKAEIASLAPQLVATSRVYLLRAQAKAKARGLAWRPISARSELRNLALARRKPTHERPRKISPRIYRKATRMLDRAHAWADKDEAYDIAVDISVEP